MWFANDIFNVWYCKYESMNEDLFWKLFKKTLQKHFASQRFRLINKEQKFKEFKQRFKQFVSQLCAHLNSLENQLFERFHENQRASHLFFALYSYIRDAIIRKHENCTTKTQIEKSIVLIKRIKSNFDMSNRYRRENFQIFFDQNLKSRWTNFQQTRRRVISLQWIENEIILLCWAIQIESLRLRFVLHASIKSRRNNAVSSHAFKMSFIKRFLC
jgi:hypothetical protein